MTRVLVILGHPVPGAFCAALADAYQKGAEGAGHDVRRIDVGALEIDPVLRTGFAPRRDEEPALLAARRDVEWAEHLVLIWPLWLGDAPAILKGFLERLLSEGFAVEKLEEPPFYRPLLGGRTARVVTTMQMPLFAYRIWAWSAANRILRTQVLNFVGIRPVLETILTRVEASTPERRAKWLDDMERLGAKAE
ncbi:MAG: NAD(P)H-dependent oxidoreductase [Pseudomonadota bacterium]